jgi:hypothetical protein
MFVIRGSVTLESLPPLSWPKHGVSKAPTAAKTTEIFSDFMPDPFDGHYSYDNRADCRGAGLWRDFGEGEANLFAGQTKRTPAGEIFLRHRVGGRAVTTNDMAPPHWRKQNLAYVADGSEYGFYVGSEVGAVDGRAFGRAGREQMVVATFAVVVVHETHGLGRAVKPVARGPHG